MFGYKNDYVKAYNLFRLDFMYYMMELLRFCEEWVTWTGYCLESIIIYIIVNRSLDHKKRIKQCDPFIFFISSLWRSNLQEYQDKLKTYMY